MSRARFLARLGAMLLLSFVPAVRAQSVNAVIASGPHVTLDQAIRLALEENQNIKVEAYSPQIARANWVAALGQFDPALTFNRSYSRNDSLAAADPISLNQIKTDTYGAAVQGLMPWGLTYSVGANAENQRGTFNRFTDQYATFAGVNFTQPLLRGFGFGANLVNVRVARANRSISEWQYRQTLIDTVTNVINAYSNLVLAHDELRIAHGSRDLAATLLTQNEQRLKAGSSAQSDVTTARAQVAQREENILLAENAVLQSDNQLRELMGEKAFPRGQPLLVIDPPAPLAVTVDPAKDLSAAYSQRPDYQAARVGITIDRANESSARNQLLPQLNLVASYGYNGLDRNFAASRHLVGTEDFPSSSIGFNVSIPLTDAQGRGRARAARLQRQQAETDLKRLEADIAVDVANAASQIETSAQRVAADRTAYNLANQALSDEEKKLRAGSSSTLAVIQAQQILISEENSVASALAAQRQAAANYDRELGATLQRYTITLADNR